MTYLPILCATLVLTITQAYPQHIQSFQESQPFIENKNVNIIVNVNPNELAEELWKVIAARLNNGTSHLTSARSTIKDLKKAIIPFVSPARRGAIIPSVFHLANQLDKISRKALTRNTPTMNMLDEEIMVRDIVADMMASLKMQISKIIQLKTEEIDNSAFSRRTMYDPTAINNDKDDYVNVKIKMRKQDIVNAFN